MEPYEMATLPDEVVAMDQMTFTDTSGTCCDVQWTQANDAYWYVVRVSDELDVVATNLGNIVGGLDGPISRPLTPSET